MHFPVFPWCSAISLYLFILLVSITPLTSLSSSATHNDQQQPTHNRNDIDDIQAYVESLVSDPESPYKAAIESAIDESYHHSDLLSSLPSTPEQQYCSVDRQSDCFDGEATSASGNVVDHRQPASLTNHDSLHSLLGAMDMSNLRLDQLLEQLIVLTQKYPDQVDEAIRTFQQMIKLSQ